MFWSMDPSLELSDEQLKAIGRITVDFAHLENSVRLCINYLSGLELDDNVLIMLNPLSFRNLVTVFSNLAERNFAENSTKLAQLRRLARNLGNVEDKRDIVTHSAWIGLESGRVLRVKAPRRIKQAP